MIYSEKELFGGAITSDLPTNWKDLSDIRPIPDNQECFQDNFVSDDPTMLVVEILERQEHIEDDDAATFFFNELAERNDALQTENDIRFHTTSQAHASSTAALLNDDSIVAGINAIRICAGSGYQKVAMGRDFDTAGNSRRPRQKIKCIRVDLCVFRLPVQETDLLITISSPVDNTNLDDVPLESLQASILSRVVSTFRIHNWNLFG